MTTITATELARNLSRVLDRLEGGSGSLVVERNGRPVATLVPGVPAQSASEAMADLHGTLDDATGRAWLRDARAWRRWKGPGLRDPWA